MHTLVNHLPPHRRHSYLELGHFNGRNFESIDAADKTSVDIQVWDDSRPPTFIGTTDEFFSQVDPDMRWDVVFIDACHEVTQVSRDLCNVAAHAHSETIVIIHDPWPAREELTAMYYCGDGYRLLLGAIRAELFYGRIMDDEYGTVVWPWPFPKHIGSPLLPDVLWGEFVAEMNHMSVQRLSLAKMQEYMRSFE